MTVNSREKGKRGEREVAQEFRDAGIECRRGVQYQGGPGSPDVVPNLPGWHFEVKYRQALQLDAALRQAGEDTAAGDLSAVIHRRKREPWKVTMTLGTFLKLMTERIHDENPVRDRREAGCKGSRVDPDRPGVRRPDLKQQP